MNDEIFIDNLYAKKQPKEKKPQQAIIKYLKETYPTGKVYKLSEESLNGIPDIMFLYNGHTYFFEVKRPAHGNKKEGRRRKTQEVFMRAAVFNGIPCGFVSSVEDVKKIISNFNA